MPQFMQDADRIVGGEAAPSMIPWQVAMLSGNLQFCGGTVIDSCTILTATHCGICKLEGMIDPIVYTDNSVCYFATRKGRSSVEKVRFLCRFFIVGATGS